MKTKHLLPLALAIVALALVARRFSSEPRGLPAGETGREAAATQGRGDEPGGPELAALPQDDESGLDRVAAESSRVGNFSATPTAGPSRRVEAEIVWPDAARPAGPVEVLAFSRDVPGSAALRMALSGGALDIDAMMSLDALLSPPPRDGTSVSIGLSRGAAVGGSCVTTAVPRQSRKSSPTAADSLHDTTCTYRPPKQYLRK